MHGSEQELRMTVPCLAVLHFSSASSVAVIDLLPTAPCSPDTLIPRIRSKWGLSKAGVCSAFVLFRIPLGERRYRSSGEWRRIHYSRRGGKWETLGRYVLIHLQPLHSLFFLFFDEHIDVIMRMGLLAPFKLSGCRLPIWKCAQPMHRVLGPSLGS